MQLHFSRLTARTLILLAFPVLAAAYCIAAVVLPAILHAVVPETVRSVLSLI